MHWLQIDFKPSIGLSFVTLQTQYSDPTQNLSYDFFIKDPAHHPLQRVLYGHIFHI